MLLPQQLPYPPALLIKDRVNRWKNNPVADLKCYRVFPDGSALLRTSCGFLVSVIALPSLNSEAYLNKSFRKEYPGKIFNLNELFPPHIVTNIVSL